MSVPVIINNGAIQAGTLDIQTGGTPTTAISIDGSQNVTIDGNLLIPTDLFIGVTSGTSNSLTTVNGTYSSLVDISIVGVSNDFPLTIRNSSATSTQTTLVTASTKSGSPGVYAPVTNGDQLGVFGSLGSVDTTNVYAVFGQLGFAVDNTGTVSPTSAPGYFSLQLTPDGSLNTAEVLALNNAGALGFYTGGGTDFGTSGYVLQSQGSTGAPQWVAPASGSSVTIHDDTTTATAEYLLSSRATSGTLADVYTAAANLTYTPSTNTLGVGVVAMSSISGGDQVTFTNPDGSLNVIGGFTFDGTTLTTPSVTSTNDALINGITSGQGAGANTSSTVFGRSALATADGGSNTAIGSAALNAATGSGNTAVGRNALNLTTGNNNVAIGLGAGEAITSGDNNVILGGYDGSAAPISATGSNFIVLSDGGANIPVYWNGTTSEMFVGGTSGNAGDVLTSGGAGVAPSWAAVGGTGTVTSVSGTGTVSGLTLTGTVTTSGSLILGGTLDLSSPPAIGGTTPNTGAFTSVTDTGLTATQVVYAGTGGLLSSSANMTFSGTALTLANDALIHGITVGAGPNGDYSDVAIGHQAYLTNADTNANNVAVGFLSCRNNAGGSFNTCVGAQSNESGTKSYTTAIGYQAGLAGNGSNGLFLGAYAGSANISGTGNTIIGAYDGSTAPINLTGNGFTVISGSSDGVVKAYWDSTGTLFNTGTINALGAPSVFGALFQNSAETTNIIATSPTDPQEVYLSGGAVQFFTADATNNWTLDIAFDSGYTLDSVLAVGQSTTCAVLVTQGATPYYNSAVTIDGAAVTVNWQGGTAPSAGNASGIDTYTYTIIKTGNAAFTVLASLTQF